MKGTLTEAERERMMAEANARDEHNRGHAWWVRVTSPQRKQMLRAAIELILKEAA